MRKVNIENKKLNEILKERGVLFDKLGKINEQLMELDKERTKLGYKMDKLKDKTKKIMDKQDIEVGQYELITRIYINDNGENEIEILDQIEEYKKMLDEKEDEKKDENR